MKSLYLVKNQTTQYNLVCAFDEEQKRQVYQLRLKHTQIDFPHVSRIEQVIDQFDKDSSHILIQDRSSGAYVATIRLSKPVTRFTAYPTLPCQTLNSNTLTFIEQVVATGSSLTLSEISRFSIDPNYSQNEDRLNSLTEIAYIAAYSMARLRFDDRILLSLPHKVFKRLRAKGLNLEYTSSNHTDKDETLFWLSSENGIQTNSPNYELYQYILGCIAHQVNQPKIECDEYNVQKGC